MRILRTKSMQATFSNHMYNSPRFVTINECQTYRMGGGKKSIGPNINYVEFLTTASNVLHVHFQISESDLRISTIQCNQKWQFPEHYNLCSEASSDRSVPHSNSIASSAQRSASSYMTTAFNVPDAQMFRHDVCHCAECRTRAPGTPPADSHRDELSTPHRLTSLTL